MVINAYVRENAGDAALLSVCLQHVQEAFPHADVAIAGMEDAAVHPSFEGVRNIGSIRRHVADGTVSLPRRLLRKALVGLAGTAAVMLPRPLAKGVLRALPAEARREADAVTRADLVVSMGGGYVLARPGLDGYQNVFFVLLPALLAQKAGVPVVWAPQSFGPFPAAAQRKLVGRVMRRSAAVLPREDVSVGELLACGIPAQHIERAVDAGFAFDPEGRVDWRAKLGVGPDERLVGITARRWLVPAAQERYERELARTIDAVQATGARAVLIPQVSTDYLGDDDRICERRIAAHCTSGPLMVDEVVDYRDLKGLYDECTLLIGTRFHSVIFSLTSNVPCVAIEYEHKTRGIMADLGLGEWVVPIADVTHDKLWALVEPLLKDPAPYRTILDANLPGYVARAQSLPARLRESV
ncbi:polysaccharide pyruvyl transferase family protein [Streptomyces fulvoviolaceus]|uniref:polysaccharide pyruvyl transferase family protein n=1 Tax=Streptomyces fulvoviolaceus TaxID=285535 RepID=UPI0021BFC21D|nr:polysaccharide pyruvyl transferase family protein [Streptomyces fulvoviolaceus]MCT9082297.1 polysaccharide pyruvyl transferase family protein [Streptomyces fulvoviolaceus]